MNKTTYYLFIHQNFEFIYGNDIFCSFLYNRNAIKLIQFKQLTEDRIRMQQNHREQILKLLDLDSLIHEYLAEPVKHKKKNLNQKSQNGMNSLRSTNLAEKSENNKNRAASMNNLKKNKSNTISYKKDNRKHESVTKLMPSSLKNGYGNESKKIWIGNKYTLSDEKTQIPEVSRTIHKSQININKKTIKQRPAGSIFQSICQIQGNGSPFRNELEQALTQTKKQIRQNLKSRKQQYLYKQKINKNMNNSQKLLKSRYLLQRIIGRGLSGIVYQAKDILSQRPVAIKIIDLANQQEYQFIKKLSHQNMIQYYNCFQENKNRYLVLEYLPMTLSEVVKQNKLEDSQIYHIFIQITNGLLYLHSMSYAHRDIKLDNIVVSSDLKTVKFIDFGLCIDVNEAQQKQFKRFCGTTSYLAPEIVQGKCKDPKKADIWALGIVLYILVVGRAPFVGRQETQIYNKIRNNKIVFPKDINESIKQLLMKILNKNPQKRPTIFSIINHNWQIK